jgi:hypothetical protein
LILLKSDYLVTEDRLGDGERSVKQQFRQIAAPNSDEAAPRQLPKNAGPEPSPPLAVVADNTQLLSVVANTVQILGQTHPVSDVVSEPPKIDHVAACPK